MHYCTELHLMSVNIILTNLQWVEIDCSFQTCQKSKSVKIVTWAKFFSLSLSQFLWGQQNDDYYCVSLSTVLVWSLLRDTEDSNK